MGRRNKGKFAKLRKGERLRRQGYYRTQFIKCVKKSGKWRGKPKSTLDAK